ncbi:putative quinol monooxygenase [Homoserinibacter sp. YIM 151385]|uniref:putative quinol monooxygenase n=1 Tax=Homoserinibacter sp. YIM 151385 TaxID=2985506 RepID=UPI0022F0DD18|nr:antibiotic biosynthesis monooxygenase family protein [Homoserinibacter sp. YIM 151385]WBU38363.1 antibiotic biosynthesis monooxygenase [Homoserinibacter sp. YIM 151385]
MSEVRLAGQLVCKNADESAPVRRYLPAHIELTEAEPGCISFEVTPTEDPLIWIVTERFAHADAFTAHQARVAGSEWGRMTAGIARDYTVSGLTD